MNKRIKELAKQAGDDSDFEIDEVTDDFLEQFALRVALECSYLALVMDASKPNAWHLGRTEMAEKILKMFQSKE